MTFDSILARAKALPAGRVALAAAQDEDALRAACEAAERGIIEPILVGDARAIEEIARNAGLHIEGMEIVDEADHTLAAKKAVGLVRAGRAELLMKGNLHTKLLLKAILDKENGLSRGSLMSHVALVQPKGSEKIVALTDGAMVMYPTLLQKAELIANAVEVMRALGVDTPKVAPLAAVEVVNPDMQATLDAAALTQMNRRSQIRHCVVDGPLGFDNAVSALAAEHKGIVSEVAGHADILLVHNIEAGNVLYKAAIFWGGADTGGLLVGAGVPVVLTSRAESARSKLNSIAAAMVYLRGREENAE